MLFFFGVEISRKFLKISRKHRTRSKEKSIGARKVSRHLTLMVVKGVRNILTPLGNLLQSIQNILIEYINDRRLAFSRAVMISLSNLSTCATPTKIANTKIALKLLGRGELKKALIKQKYQFLLFTILYRFNISTFKNKSKTLVLTYF